MSKIGEGDGGLKWLNVDLLVRAILRDFPSWFGLAAALAGCSILTLVPSSSHWPPASQAWTTLLGSSAFALLAAAVRAPKSVARELDPLTFAIQVVRLDLGGSFPPASVRLLITNRAHAPRYCSVRVKEIDGFNNVYSSIPKLIEEVAVHGGQTHGVDILTWTARGDNGPDDPIMRLTGPIGGFFAEGCIVDLPVSEPQEITLGIDVAGLRCYSLIFEAWVANRTLWATMIAVSAVAAPQYS